MNKAKEIYKENSNWNQIFLSTNTTFTSSRNDSVEQIQEKVDTEKNLNKLSEKETIVFEVIFTIIILYILFY